MKGKKADASFIADYVLKCAKRRITSQEDIVKEAEQEIAKIDVTLKSIIDLKKKRSKLVDVVSSFKEKVNSTDKSTLDFYSIKDLKFAACFIDKALPILESVEFFTEVASKEYLFLIKQLVNLKVLGISSSSYRLFRAERFNEFISFLEEKKL